MCLLLSGCPMPVPPVPTPLNAHLQPYSSGLISWEIGLDAVESTGNDPDPDPDPNPNPNPGVCSNCRGTCRLGDGTVSVQCPVCGGTGRITTEQIIDPIIDQVDQVEVDPIVDQIEVNPIIEQSPVKTEIKLFRSRRRNR